MEGGPRVQAFGGAEAGERGFVQWDAQLERGEDLRADVRANLVHVIAVRLVVLGPHHTAVARVDELDRHVQRRATDALDRA